jgi:hypothetical protein
VSANWITAVASGQIARSRDGQVLPDLVGDGLKQTGWVILYLHVAAQAGQRRPGGAQIGDSHDPG